MSDVNEPLIGESKMPFMKRFEYWCNHTMWNTNFLIVIIRALVIIFVIWCLSAAIRNVRNGREPFAFITDLIH